MGNTPVSPVKLENQQTTPDGAPFPLVLAPTSPLDTSLPELVRTNKEWIEQQLLQSGAILFRGFNCPSPSEFNDVVLAFDYPKGEFIGGGGPRKHLIGDVFTSTESPAHLNINFHHELAYLPHFPKTIFFYCDLPTLTAGETPILHSNKLFLRIQKELPEFAQQFEQKGLKYTRMIESDSQTDLANQYQRSWEQIFETTNREEAEAAAKRCGHELVEWQPNGSMKVRSVKMDGIRVDPRTGKKTWFNSAILLHPALAGIPVEDAAWCTTYGDESPIDSDSLVKVSKIMREESFQYQWQKGDFIMIDNWTTMHARNSFEGPRRVAVAMYQ